MLLSATGIRKSFSGVTVLDNVHFDLERAEVHALLGENGAGKSTLLKILFGVHQPDAGEIQIDGQPHELHSPHDARDQGIAMIHQELSLVPEMSIAQNVLLGREGMGERLNYRELDKRAAPFLEMVGLNLSPRTQVKKLTIAEQQLVEIARALSLQARILIMDEPTSSLSPREVERLYTVIQQLLERQVGLIYVSHHLDEVQFLAQRMTVLRDGKYIATFKRGEVSREQLVASMVGREISAGRTRTTAARETIALQVRGLGKPKIFEDINLEVREGEVVTLAGLVGARRTDVLRAIVGADPGVSGEVRLWNQSLPRRTPQLMARHGVSFAPEDRRKQGIVPERSVRVNLLLTAWAKNLAGVNGTAAQRAVEQAMGRLSIKPANPEQRVVRLSGGNQQKVVLARALASGCKLLLIDEPTRGIDVSSKAEIYALIDQLADAGTAILLVSSELPEVLRLSDRVLVMRQGRIVGEVARASASEEGILALATGVSHAN